MSAHLKATSIFIVALCVGGLGVAPAPPTASPGPACKSPEIVNPMLATRSRPISVR